MDARKLAAIILMVVIIATGANVLRKEVSRSQAEYHPPLDTGGTSHTEQWRDATAGEKSEAEKSITAQLEAFKQDDYLKAATYQSMTLKGKFPTAAVFKATIQHGYPQFAHYKSVLFGDVKARPGEGVVAVPIKLTGEDGVTVTAVYYMQMELGGFKVAGVFGGGARRLPSRSQKAT